MKKEVMSFAVVVKGGIVQQIGKGVVSRPETCFSGQPTKWAKDIYKKVTTDTTKTTGFETETYFIKSQADYERSADAITHRNGKIIIQVVQGTVISNNGDGELDTGDYIKYDADLKQGDRVETVLVYNPADYSGAL